MCDRSEPSAHNSTSPANRTGRLYAVRLRLMTLAFVVPLAACGTTPPPSSPSASGSVQGAVATPASTAGTVPTEAIVAWVVDDDAPFFDLVVESIAPTGVARPVARLRDVHPAGWADASPRLDAPVLASETGLVVISVDRSGGGTPEDERTLILDLDSPGRAPIEFPNVTERAAWGPGGELAIFGTRPLLLDPATGTTTAITVPPHIDLLEAWVADGSGWLAVEEGDAGRVGVLRRNGTFAAGAQPAYGLTGRERRTGSNGQIVSEATSDGATGAETTIVDFGPGICPRCVVWAKFETPGDGPTFNDFVWDASGQGLWITWQSADRKRGWLGHMASPGVDEPIVDLPARVDLDIVGISPTDAWLVLKAGEQRRLILADTLTRETRVIAKPLVPGGPTPIFAGWSSVPHG
jgi:hypothetical protein